MNKLNTLLLSALMISTLIVGCTEDDPVIDITEIKFDGDKVIVTEGLTYDLNDAITIIGDDADQADISFSSADAAVVSVDGNTLTAEAVGTTTVTATESNSGLTASVEVVVEAKAVAVTGVTLDKDEANLKAGESFQLTATIAPANATETGLTWSVGFPPESKNSEDTPEAIATVSETGLVTAISAGAVVVTVKTKDGEFTAATNVAVTNVAVTGVTISPSEVSVNVNESVQLTATVAPENATINTVEWSVSIANDPQAGRVMDIPAVEDYLEITEDGLLKAKNKAEPGYIYTVTATTIDGEKTDAKEVTINYTPVTSFTLSEDDHFVVAVGDTHQISISDILPLDASDKTITLSLSIGPAACRMATSALTIDDYATIDANGLISGISSSYSTCGLILTATHPDLTPVEVDFNVLQLVTELTILDEIGSPVDNTIDVECGTTDFGYSALPGNADNSNVTWSIDNDTDFDIDQNGVLNAPTGLPSGIYTTKLTITAQDGSGIKKEITVTYDRDGCI